MSDDFQTCPCCGATLPCKSSKKAVTPALTPVRSPPPIVDQGMGAPAPPPVLEKRKIRIASPDRLIRPVFQLLTHRLPKPGVETPGFPDAYYCPQCQDYFTLAWHPSYSPLVRQCEIVPDTHPLLRGRDPRMAAVFCPNCGTSRRIYGKIPHPEASAFRADDTRLLHSYDYRLLPGVPSRPAGSMEPGGPRIEKVVLFVTGKFPGGLDVKEFAYSILSASVFPKFRSGFRVSERGDSRLHVLRVSKIVNRSEWVASIVQRELYPAENCRMKLFAIADRVTLEPPLREAAFCMVFPYRLARKETLKREISECLQ
jgi:hypothetical protein